MVSLGSVARIISTPEPVEKVEVSNKSGMQRLKYHIEKRPKVPAAKPSETTEAAPSDLYQDQFLTLDELITPTSDLIKKAKKRNLDDILELTRNNQWDDILSLYHPVDEKAPDLVKATMDLPIREKVAFALGQLGRFDEAIAELSICIKREPENFYTRSSLAYTAYNSLFALKNREIMLTPEEKAKRIALAHDNFEKTLSLRPDNVTNLYRHGMLYSKIEGKDDPALPLFRRACEAWEALSSPEQIERHQERKNYIKSLYRLGSLLLNTGDATGALKRIETCIELDSKRNHISLTFKYFALGKIHFHMGDHKAARDALVFAYQSSHGKPGDFVVELLARTLLALGQPQKGLDMIEKIPVHGRRPYVRWTESDVLCALHRFKDATHVLQASMEKDMRMKHKTLIRLTKIHYLQQRFDKAAECAKQAGVFFQRQWNNPYSDALFWQALCMFRMGKREQAEHFATALQEQFSVYPKLDMLMGAIKKEA